MDASSQQNHQNRDTTSKSPSRLLGNGLFQSESLIQSPAQPSTSALDEASRDAETFGSTGETAFDAYSKHPMPFNNGYYQPTEGACLPTPHGHLVPEGNPLSRLTARDSSPIFADTVLSENVRKRFLFAKNQRHIPIPAASEESSGLTGQNRSNIHKHGDFVNYGAGAIFKEKRLEAIREELGTPLQDPSDGQFQNQNQSYNTPIGFTNKYTAQIPASVSNMSPAFVEPHRPEGRGVFKKPLPSLRDRQAPHSHVSMDQDSEGGTNFTSEQLVPLHSFSPEKLVPRYPMDSSTSSPQEHSPTKKLLGPPICYTEGRCQQGLPGTTQELHSAERAGDTTTPHPFNPSVEEFIARQSTKARPRPPYWQTKCHWTTQPLGDAVGSCHYGRSCLYGHDGDVYNDNLSVYYTFENGRSCPNFIPPATPGPPLGAQGPCSPPHVVPEANPQAQAFHAGQTNQALGDARAGHIPANCDMEGGAPAVQPDSPWLHAPQHATLSNDQPASSTEASFTVDESLFRREPLLRVADYINYIINGFQSQAVGNIATSTEAQYTMSDEGASDSFQGD